MHQLSNAEEEWLHTPAVSQHQGLPACLFYVIFSSGCTGLFPVCKRRTIVNAFQPRRQGLQLYKEKETGCMLGVTCLSCRVCGPTPARSQIRVRAQVLAVTMLNGPLRVSQLRLICKTTSRQAALGFENNRNKWFLPATDTELNCKSVAAEGRLCVRAAVTENEMIKGGGKVSNVSLIELTNAVRGST